MILLLRDDHGWEETGYNGHPVVRTPVLDAMAAEGLRFDHFYAAHPTCSPTRGSILTGRHPNRYGTFTPNYSIRPEEITLADLLGEAGYLRGHFGKWHVGPVDAASPTNPGAMGFDEWLSHDNFFELDPPLSDNGGPPRVYPGESSAVLIDRTLRFIDEAREQDRPFLAFVWFASPHEPYSGLPEDLALYDDLPARYAGRDSITLTSNETGRPVRRALGDALRERYAEITAMDRAIGRLRDYLRDQDLRDNTIVWYVGDNGTPPGESVDTPLRGAKGDVYEGGTRVPAVVEWPARIATPCATRVPAVTSDFLPTLAAIAGVSVPSGRPLDGRDLGPVLDGTLDTRPEPIFFWQYDTRQLAGRDLQPWIDPDLQRGTTPLVKLMNGIATRNFTNYRFPEITAGDRRGPRAMVDNRYKLVVRDGPDSAPVLELFDIEADPAETVDLAGREPAVAATMQAALEAWQASVLESLSGADYGMGNAGR
ncbi:MAG: sulfatase-like hydrolase/transferase [Rhodothermales bacterium]